MHCRGTTSEANNLKSRDQPTSSKQMRRLGEPQRKVRRREEQSGNPTPRLEGLLGDQATDAPKAKQEETTKKESGAQRRMRKATRRANQEQKRKARKVKDAEKAKKKKEREEELRRKGEMLMKRKLTSCIYA